MNAAWTKADAWFRRDVGDGTHLTVSRTRDGLWSRRRGAPAGGILAKSSWVFTTAVAAMHEADALVIGLVAA